MRKLMIGAALLSVSMLAGCSKAPETANADVNAAEVVPPSETADNMTNAADNMTNAAENMTNAADNMANATDQGSTDHGSTDH